MRTWNGSATTTTIFDDRGLRIEHDDDELVVVDYYGDEQGRHDEAELDR